MPTPTKKTHATTAAELAPYFVTPKEAACPCCGIIYISFAVLERFRRVRLAHGGPLDISSGYRCNKHQTDVWNRATPEERKLGLVAKPGSSPHEKGEALDVLKPAKFKTAREWGAFIVKTLNSDIRVGCLRYAGFAHMDTLHLLLASYGRGILW